MSLIDKIFPKVEFEQNYPMKIKIERYKFTFTSIEERNKTNKVWKKVFVKEFFAAAEKAQIQKVFENYSLPKIDEYRDISISPFQLINIVDIVLIIIFIYITNNMFFRK